MICCEHYRKTPESLRTVRGRPSALLAITPFFLAFAAASAASAESEPIAMRMFSSGSESSAPVESPLAGAIDSIISQSPPSQPLTPKEQSLRLNEAGVELVLQGKRADGIEKIKQALVLDPKNTTVLYNLAGLHLADGEADQAMSLMERALAVEPGDLSFLNRFAESCVSASNIPKAVSSYERIAEVDPKFNEVLLKLGTLHAMQQEWEKAEAALRKAREMLGDDPRVLSNLGSVLVVREKYEDAIRFLELSQEKARTAENAVVLGIANESLGRLDAALQHYREAQSLGERGGDLQQHVSRLESLRQPAEPRAEVQVTAAATTASNGPGADKGSDLLGGLSQK